MLDFLDRHLSAFFINERARHSTIDPIKPQPDLFPAPKLRYISDDNSPLQFELDDAPALEVLLSAYPRPVTVSELPHPPTEDLEDKVCALVVGSCCSRYCFAKLHRSVHCCEYRRSTKLQQVTQDRTPPGPSVKAPLLLIERSVGREQGSVGTILYRPQLSENVPFDVGTVLSAE